MKLTLVTERPATANTRANMDTMLAHLGTDEGDLLAFGELFLQGYMSKDHFFRNAVSADGPEVGELRDAAKAAGKALLFGFARRDDDRRGVLYDSAALIRRDGKVETYDKWFPANFGPFEERQWFGEGRRLPIVDVEGVRVGIQICYDLFFPELSKAYALKGADLMVNLSCSPVTSRANFEKTFPARAIECANYFAYCNVVGTMEDMVFWGGSQVWGPRGNAKVVAPVLEPSVVSADISLDEVSAARALRPTLRDTRREMLDALVQSFEGSHA